MECRIEPKVGVVIVAGGSGKRMGGATPKQFRILGQAPVLVHSINALSEGMHPSEIVVVLPAEHVEFWGNLASRFNVAEHKVVAGGQERFHSVKAGIDALSECVDLIAVHDGVRPLCSVELLARCLECAKEHGSSIPVVEVVDSVRKVDEQGSQALDRRQLRAVQTPQTFDAPTLRRAYLAPYSPQLTDDASLVEAQGVAVALTQGERSNIKITSGEDLLLAQMILEKRDESRDL